MLSIQLPFGATANDFAQAHQLIDLAQQVLMGQATIRNEAVPHVHAPTAKPAPPPPETAAFAPVERDKSGLPWDERIHAGSKTTNANGSWKKRKGVQESLVKTVEAELRAAYPVASSAPPLTTAAADTTPPPTTAFQQAVAPTLAPPPPVAVVATAPAPADANTFVGLMQKVTALLTANTLSREQVMEICKQAGAVGADGQGTLKILATRADLVPTVNSLIDAATI